MASENTNIPAVKAKDIRRRKLCVVGENLRGLAARGLPRVRGRSRLSHPVEFVRHSSRPGTEVSAFAEKTAQVPVHKSLRFKRLRMALSLRQGLEKRTNTMSATGIATAACDGSREPSPTITTTLMLTRTVPSTPNDDFLSEERVRSESQFPGIAGESAALRQLLRLVETVARPIPPCSW
jgi:hypothetical protein